MVEGMSNDKQFTTFFEHSWLVIYDSLKYITTEASSAIT